MAARLAPNNVRRMHQSLHHLVAHAPWSDDALLRAVQDRVLPAMEKQAPVVAWNCQVGVSLSVATWKASLPIAYQLYLPESWAKDVKRRRETGVPEEVEFHTQPQIALRQIRKAVAAGVHRGMVMADAAYGNDTDFRASLSELELRYVVGIQSSMSVWAPGTNPLPAKRWPGTGRPPRLLRRDRQHQPISVKELSLALGSAAWKSITWRKGTARKLQSRFAAVPVRPAHRDYWRADPPAEEWLLVEWPSGENEPTKYWLSTLPPETKLKDLVKIAKHRWIIERDYQELKQELGLGHFEGRGWRGFHHHATLCIAAYGFLVAERSRFFPSARAGRLDLPAPKLPPGFQPRGRSAAMRTA